TVTVPNNEDAGKLNIQIIATSEDPGDNPETSQQGVKPDVNYIPDFIVTPYGDNQKDVKPKKTVTYGISVENKGNDEDTFQFSIVPGTWSAAGWSASLQYSSVKVLQNEKVDLSSFLDVNAPDGLADDEAQIVINVTTEDGTLTKTLNTRTTILQEYDPAISIVGGTTKDVYPGQSVDFNITVFNNGNGEDEITLHIKNADQTPGSWGSFSDSSATLDAHTNITITLTVTPPSDASYLDEGYTLEIYGVSEDGTNESSHKTLKVNVEKKFDLSLTISGASTKKADPDDVVEYTVDVKNKGNYLDTILLTLYGEGNNWKPDWGSIISSVDLDKGVSTSIILSVTVDSKAEKADYKIGIKATSDEDPSPNPVNKTTEVIVSVNQTYGIIITYIGGNQKTVDVDSSVDYTVNIKNDGTGNDTLTLDVTVYPDNWVVNFDKSTLDLEAGVSENVTMNVKTPTSEDSKAFFVNFTATSEEAPDNDPAVKTGSTITTVNQTYEFDINPTPDYMSVQPGETIEFNVSFENKGTGDDHIKVVKGGNYPTTWTVSIASDVSINRDQTVYKTLTVSIDDETLKGEYQITLTGTSDDDPHIPAFSRQVNITINVEQEYNLTASIGTDTKSVDPFPQGVDHKVTFTFTVNNTGTGQDKFKFKADLDNTPGGWSLSFDPVTLDLGVKVEGDVNATVSVPFKETIATYSIPITITSEGDISVERTITIYVDVNQTYSLDIVSDLNTQQITPSKIQGKLKEVNFTLTITNTGTGDDKFYLSLNGLPAGWFMNLPGNTGTIAKDDSKDVVLNLKVPGREDPETYNLSVKAVSDGRATVDETINLSVVVDELHALDLTTNEPIKKGDENNFTHFDIQVTNKGTGVDTFTFDYRDVPDELTISFPEGTGTEELGPNNQTTKRVRVFVEDKTPKAKFYFNITVTSDEDEDIEKAIRLTVDVNQSYEIKASLVSAPTGYKADPDATVIYQWEVNNTGTGTDSVTVDVPIKIDNQTNIPAGWVVTPTPRTFDLDSNAMRTVDIEVQVSDEAIPETVIILVWFQFHDDEEKLMKNITVNVNQTYDVSINIPADVKIYPGYNKTLELIIKNTGTGPDYYEIKVTKPEGSNTTITISPPLTETIGPYNRTKVEIGFEIKGGEAPKIERFIITVTSQLAKEDKLDIYENTTVDVEIGATYGISLLVDEVLVSAHPAHDHDGWIDFIITVENAGTGRDTFKLELVDERPNSTIGKYNKWARLSPTSITLEPKASADVILNVTVPRYKADADAISDNVTKDIKVLVYSDNARENLVEEERKTTKTFLAHVRIREYYYAFFASNPSVDVNREETKTLTMTLMSEGNGVETYHFTRTGEDPTGAHMDWYWFTFEDKAVVEPGGSTIINITVQPGSAARIGSHNLRLYASPASEPAYETEHSYLTYNIPETVDASWSSGDSKPLNPKTQTSVDLRITVKNNGTSEGFNLIELKDPTNLPPEWAFTWSGGSSQRINPGSTHPFILRITVPGDNTKVPVGSHEMHVNGTYETLGGGKEEIPGFVTVSVIVEPVYDVEVDTDQDKIEGKDPGDNATFIANVKNTGNTNETFQLSLLSGSGNNAMDWATIEEGDQIVIMPGDTKAVHVRIDIPAFSVEDDDAQMGDYSVRLQAYPLKDDSKKKTVEFTVGVDETFDLEIKADSPWKDENLEPEGHTVLYYTVAVRNLANTDDTIEVTVPEDELSGDKSHFTPTFSVGGGSYAKILPISMDSLDKSDVTMKLDIDAEGKEGQYTLKVKATSQGDTAVDQYVTLNLNLSKTKFEAKIWADNPGKNSTLKEGESIELTFILYIRNMGDREDTFDLFVPSDEFPEDYDWKVYFGVSGTKTEKTIILKSEEQATETIRIIIDKKTDEDNYELRVKAESQGDTAVYGYVTLYLNLTEASYGVELEPVIRPVQEVNPSDESEIDFKFTLTNIGNQDDTYTVEIETSLTSGKYKDWTVEFEDKDFNRLDKLALPEHLTGDTYLGKRDGIDVTIYVIVDVDEDEGVYPDITISATSDNDNTKVAYLSFNLTVIKPNIEVNNDKSDFYIEGDLSDLEEDDSIDIGVRVYNKGSAETDEFYVWFYNGKRNSPSEQAGTPIMPRERVDNIPAGQYIDVLVTWDNIPAGENDLYVFADKPIKSGQYGTEGPDGKFHP
ncbi:MAG: hypothetical protein KAU14_02050, partial [Thermoplasmata archaeon]|nr:hypothetical protein [Thermoplasmata archaeon]